MNSLGQGSANDAGCRGRGELPAKAALGLTIPPSLLPPVMSTMRQALLTDRAGGHGTPYGSVASLRPLAKNDTVW